jgi:hypothetical protein
MQLDPGYAVYYTWQQPVSQRQLMWHSKEFCTQSNDLLEVSSFIRFLNLTFSVAINNVFLLVTFCTTQYLLGCTKRVY